MAKRDKSSVPIASNLGHHALVLNEDDVVRLLRGKVIGDEPGNTDSDPDPSEKAVS